MYPDGGPLSGENGKQSAANLKLLKHNETMKNPRYQAECDARCHVPPASTSCPVMTTDGRRDGPELTATGDAVGAEADDQVFLRYAAECWCARATIRGCPCVTA